MQLIAAQGECVRWTTPLGLPVVQPYVKGDRPKLARTSLAVLTLSNKSSKSKVRFPLEQLPYTRKSIR